MRLHGQKIVIIGGSSGIGLAIGQMAAAEGATVIIGGRSEEKLQKTKANIHGKVEAFTVNVMDEGLVRAFFEKVGEFNHLTTPGSEAAMGRFLEMDTRAARASFDSKFWGQYHAAKYGSPRILAGVQSLFSPESGAKGQYLEAQ